MTAQIWYHKACTDGFGAAWAAWQRFGDGATYQPLAYGDAVPTLHPGTVKEIWILDFSFPRSEMLTLLEWCRRHGVRLTLLDHHQSAAEDLGGIAPALVDDRTVIKIDRSRSGAVLAWEYLHPNWEVPDLLRFVQDRDLWQWRLPQSREFSTWLRAEPQDFDRWSEIAEGLRSPVQRPLIMTEACAMHRMLEAQVRALGMLSRPGLVLGHGVPIANVTLHQSEVGEILCLAFPEAPFSATYYDRPEGDRVWSLRSKGGFDCQALARQVQGGGGHPSAAGFRSKQDNTIVMADGSVATGLLR